MPGHFPFSAHRADLAALAHDSRRRTLAPRAGRDFASNDYLGLADSEALRTALAAGIERGLPAARAARACSVAITPNMRRSRPTPRAITAAKLRSSSRPVSPPTPRCLPRSRSAATSSSTTNSSTRARTTA